MITTNFIVMIGAFPPPMHGMAAVNNAVKQQLDGCGSKPLVIDVAANSLERTLMARLGRFPKVLKGLLQLHMGRKAHGGTLYMSISGGFGQIYEVLFVLAARLKKMRIYLHHHSFAYLDKPMLITHLLTAIAGKNSVHITQSKGMAARLGEQYAYVKRVIPISNVVFLVDDAHQDENQHKTFKSIGYISNLSEEKGVFEFLRLVEAYEVKGIELKAYLAGPFQDDDTRDNVLHRIEQLNTVEYVGAKFGKAKDEFFSSIDALVFPTLYANETEGIVNLEAMSRGLPVIAYGRGCIPEIIKNGAGLVVEPGGDFVSPALSMIQRWYDSPETYQLASDRAKSNFARMLAENHQRWLGLLNEMQDCRTCCSNGGAE